VGKNLAQCSYALFRGGLDGLPSVYFVSAALKNEWLRIGVSPHFFEICHH
jgi:hypothetical protein